MTGDLLRPVDVLLQHHVPLVIIGGLAVNAHGYLRSTADVDVVFRRTKESETQLFKALDSLNAFWIGNEIDSKTGIEATHPVTLAFVQSKRLMMLGSDHGYLDLFDYLPGLPADELSELFDSAIDINGRPHCSLRMLRRLKKAAGRPQDLIDLENLPEE